MLLIILVASLGLVASLYAVGLLVVAIRSGQWRPRLEGVVLGAVTNFLDTLGIGSFAPTVAWLRFRRLVPDRQIPLTMLGGYIIPSILQAVIFLILLGVKVDPLLLLGCIVAMVVGGLLGVPLALRLPIRAVRLVVALALLAAAFFMSIGNLGLMPAGGTATSLPPLYFAAAIALHFVLGLLISFGVGNYAPTLAALSLMGMDPRLSFPIMASAASFSGMAAASQLIRTAKLDLRLVVGLALGAVPAVLVAAFIVKTMPLDQLRWLVVAVVLYASATLFASALRGAETVPDDAAETALLD